MKLLGQAEFLGTFGPDRENFVGEINLLLGGKQLTNASKFGTIEF